MDDFVEKIKDLTKSLQIETLPAYDISSKTESAWLDD